MTDSITRPPMLPDALLGTADAAPRTRAVLDAAALVERCPGHVHLPGDPGFNPARAAWAAAVDQRPAVVVEPGTVHEVAAVVRGAGELGLRVAPQGTGHNAAPLAAQGLEDVVLLRTGRLDEVRVDPERQVVRVGAGQTWLPVVEAAAAAGCSVLHGSSPDVGVAGYALGGGIGWYARALGLATNSITAIEMVTATGELLRADAGTNPEVLWALRGGGGGSFGVVTALELRLFPFDTAYGGMLVWDARRAEEALRTWAAWATTADDEVTTACRILRVPPMPGVPEAMQGRTLVVVDGAVLGTDEHAERLLAPLRALNPELDTFARVPSRSLVRLHMDPEGPTPGVSDSTVLGSLPEAGIRAFLDTVGPDATTALLAAELRQLGGAVGRPHPGGGVLSHLDGQFALFAVAIAATPEMAAAGERDATGLVSAMAPWANGRSYLNLAERPVDVRRGFPDGTWEQLVAIRSAMDPGGMFVGNHPVPRPAEEGPPTG